MKAVFVPAFMRGLTSILDLGSTRAWYGARDPNEAAIRALRAAMRDVCGELRATVASEAMFAVGADGKPIMPGGLQPASNDATATHGAAAVRMQGRRP